MGVCHARAKLGFCTEHIIKFVTVKFLGNSRALHDLAVQLIAARDHMYIQLFDLRSRDIGRRISEYFD